MPADTTNELGQVVGFPIADWRPSPLPPRRTLDGRWCRVEPIDVARHAGALQAAFATDAAGADWSYLPYGPFDTEEAFESWLHETCLSDDPMFFAIVDGQTDRAVGLASYLNIHRAHATIEVGHIHFSPALQRSRIATEAMYLMMGHAFGAGYRRYEWKCNAHNTRSRRAAQRFGFSYEGIFRQHMAVRGHNRDSAWYACVDGEWPALRDAYETWLAAENFDEAGAQRLSLSALTRPLLVATD
jgi:RimJ/RimL family protein N-acetyltransferase